MTAVSSAPVPPASLRDTYYEYLGHIALTLMIDDTSRSHAHFVSLTRLTDIMGDIAKDADGDGLIPSEDIAAALAVLIEKDILAPLDHPEQGPSYHVVGPAKAFIEAQMLVEGSTIWKCKSLPGYMQMVLQAMHEKKQQSFSA